MNRPPHDIIAEPERDALQFVAPVVGLIDDGLGGLQIGDPGPVQLDREREHHFDWCHHRAQPGKREGWGNVPGGQFRDDN